MSVVDAPQTVSVTLAHPADFEGWRNAVRRLVGAGVAPRNVTWSVGSAGGDDGDSPGLFANAPDVGELPLPSVSAAPRAPKHFAALAEWVICHKSGDRFTLLHRMLLRLQRERRLLEVASDPDVARAHLLEKNARRCAHKMKAFVRFRATQDPGGAERFVAWFEPEHHTLDKTAGFFVRRFANMRWSILTPGRCAHWDGDALLLTEGADRSLAPDGDINEDLWRTYFSAIFNPARLKVTAMRSEMPKRYWKNMPEGTLISPLVKGAVDRSSAMVAAQSNAPARSTRIGRARQEAAQRAQAAERTLESLEDLALAAAHCERCPLHGPATQVVLGEGKPGADIMFVGEQPGDHEDLIGRPFVGPAGELFDRALREAQIPRSSTFITNAVKHFKFEPRGKRRIHKSPSAGEIDHCRFWLDAERRLVRPKITVALGASAGRALSGRAVAIGRERGRLLHWPDGSAGLITTHPAAILRTQDRESEARAFAQFVDDLSTVRALIEPVASVH